MEEDELNIAEGGDKLEQDGNNLENEYGYEDEEFAGQEDEQNEDNNDDNGQKDNENEDNDEGNPEEDDEEDDEKEDEDEDEEEENEDNSNEENNNNNNEDNHNEYDFGGEESPQRNGGRVRVSRKGNVIEEEEDEEDEEEDDEDEDGDEDNDNQVDQEGSRGGKVRSRQVGKRGRETRMTQSPSSSGKDLKVPKAIGQEQNGNQEEEDDDDNENDNEMNEDDDMEEEDDEEDDMDDSKDKQKESESQNESDQNNEENDNNDGQIQGSGSMKDKKRKKNEFWKYRHKNKEEQLLKSQQIKNFSQASNLSGIVNQSSLVLPNAAAIEETPILNTLSVINQGHIARSNITNPPGKMNSFNEEESLKYALERAARFNVEILNQKMRVQEILRFHERNKQQQSRPVLLEHWTNTTLFPSNVPVEAVTEEGSKYLVNVGTFCQKSTLDEFIHKNVQQEHTDMLADLQKFGIKKPLGKNKTIKKKLTKKSTFGADLYN